MFLNVRKNRVKGFKKILVYRIGHLGDTLVSLPAFWAVRDKFPNAHITLLTNSNHNNPNYVLAQDVLPLTGLFDQILSYDAQSRNLAKIYTFGKLLLQLKSGKYDALVYLSTRNRTIRQINRDVKFFKKAGIKNRFGINYLVENLLNKPITANAFTVDSEFDFLLNCLEYDGLTAKTKEYTPDLQLNDVEKSAGYQWLETNAGEYLSKNKLLAIAPSGKWQSKIWFEESFSRVVLELIEREDVFPIIFGGLEDAEKGERLIAGWNRGANAAGVLGIREAAAALSFCRIYLGNDTGTMHLAASVGTRCAAIFSAIDWAGRWSPFGKNHRIFRQTVPCEGCLSEVCKFNQECLTAIDERNVIAACLELWRETR